MVVSMPKKLIHSENKLLLYIPSYNCAPYILSVIDSIPPETWAMADVLVIDNLSSDDTIEKLTKANSEQRWAKPVHIIQPRENLGYSGSQKLAYRFFLAHPQYKAIMMLHGDGQYDPALIPSFATFIDSEFEVVYGHRSKTKNWSKDETPWIAYLTIKSLSIFESLMTGYWRHEWHSGMVMYKRGFLSQVNFANITRSMHIDGHLLFAAGKLGVPVKGVPIYKRYKDYEALGPTARVRYVWNVLKLIPRLHFISVHRKSEGATELPTPAFDAFTTHRRQLQQPL